MLTMPKINRCVCCDAEIPEGSIVCKNCISVSIETEPPVEHIGGVPYYEAMHVLAIYARSRHIATSSTWADGYTQGFLVGYQQRDREYEDMERRNTRRRDRV